MDKQKAAAEEMSAVGAAIQRTPGNLLGGATDMMNLVLGFLAGRGTDGLVPKPVGGSAQINEAFGLPAPSTPTQEIVETVLGFADPKNLAKGAVSSAIMIPAALSKRSGAIKEAADLAKSGAAPQEVFKATGVMHDPFTGEPKAPLDITETYLNEFMFQESKEGRVRPIPNIQAKLSDVLVSPALFDAIPELRTIDFRYDPTNPGGMGYFESISTIAAGSRNSVADMTSGIVHETQHAIQGAFGFSRGANPDVFLQDPVGYNKMAERVFSDFRSLNERLSTGKVAATDELLAEHKRLSNLVDTILRRRSINYNKYLRVAGEAEARAAQSMFERGRYDEFPLSESLTGVPFEELRPSPFDLKNPK